MTEVNFFKSVFEESIAVKQKLIEGEQLHKIGEMGALLIKSFSEGHKLMLCGNGGSAADAQHLAAEMLVRLRPKINRVGIPAIALAQDTSTLTACANDLGSDCFYERMVQTLGKEGDVLIAISTSGNSENIIRAMKMASQKQILVFGFLGAGGGRALDFCDEAVVVPSKNTARIQEVHIMVGHGLLEFVENGLIENGYIEQ